MAILAIEPVIQKSTGDCGICCVVALTEKSYREAFELARKVEKKPDEGLDLTDLKKLLRLCGFKAVYRRSWNPEEQDGILAFVRRKNPRGAGGHWVVLFNHSIYSPADGLFYKYDAYLASKPALKPVGLLTFE